MGVFIKGTAHQMIYYCIHPFIMHLFVEFHGQNEFHPVDEYGTQTVKNKKQKNISPYCCVQKTRQSNVDFKQQH